MQLTLEKGIFVNFWFLFDLFMKNLLCSSRETISQPGKRGVGNETNYCFPCYLKKILESLGVGGGGGTPKKSKYIFLDRVV